MLCEGLNKVQKAALLMIVGVLLLFESWGFFRDLFIFIFRALGLALMVYGFILGDFWPKIRKLLEKPQEPKDLP